VTKTSVRHRSRHREKRPRIKTKTKITQPNTERTAIGDAVEQTFAAISGAPRITRITALGLLDGLRDGWSF
jgi:hypothetical protein